MITRKGSRGANGNTKTTETPITRRKSMTVDEGPEEADSPMEESKEPNLSQPTTRRRSGRRMNQQSTSSLDIVSELPSSATTDRLETGVKNEEKEVNQEPEKRRKRGRPPKDRSKGAVMPVAVSVASDKTPEVPAEEATFPRISPDPINTATTDNDAQLKTPKIEENKNPKPLVDYCITESDSAVDPNDEKALKADVKEEAVESQEHSVPIDPADLTCIASCMGSESTPDDQSPESPPLKDAIATAELELTDMEEVDNDSCDDPQPESLDSLHVELPVAKDKNDDLNVVVTQSTPVVSNQYITTEIVDDNMDISDMETEDEVDDERTTPSDKDTPLTDSPASKNMPEEDQRPVEDHKLSENATAALSEWKMLEYNDYTIECRERNFDNSCMCKTGRCLDLCVNWNSQIECSEDCRNPGCENNFFTTKDYRDVEVFNAGPKGSGVRAREFIRRGAFIMEYIGEVIGPDKVEKRLYRYQKQGIKHHYMFEAASGVVIDSTRKGNIMRFVNHSCNPNAIAQDWIVRGKPAIGFFSLRKIEPGEEITFNYNFMNNGAPQKCYCGAENCNGFIGKRKGSNAGQEHQVDTDNDSDGSLSSDDDGNDSDTELDNRRILKKQKRVNEVIEIMNSSNPSVYMDKLVDILNNKDGCDYDLRSKVVELLLTQAKLGDLSFIHKFIDVKGLAKLSKWMKRRYYNARLGGVSLKKKIELTAHIVSFLQSSASFLSKAQLASHKTEEIVREISNEKLEKIRGVEKEIVEDTLENTLRRLCKSGVDTFSPIWEIHENLIASTRRLVDKWEFYGFKRIPKRDRVPSPEHQSRNSIGILDRKRRDDNEFKEFSQRRDIRRERDDDDQDGQFRYLPQSFKRQHHDDPDGQFHYRPPSKRAHCDEQEDAHRLQRDYSAYNSRNFDRTIPNGALTSGGKEAYLTMLKQGKPMLAAQAFSKAALSTIVPQNQRQFPLRTPYSHGPQLADLTGPPPPPPSQAPPPQASSTPSEAAHSTKSALSRSHSSASAKDLIETSSPRKRRSRFENQPKSSKSAMFDEPGFCSAPKVSRCFKKLKVSPFLEQPEEENPALIKKEIALELVRHFAKRFIDACADVGIGFDDASAEITQRMWGYDSEYKRAGEEHASGVPRSIFAKPVVMAEEAQLPLNRNMTPAERLRSLNLLPEPTTPTLELKSETEERAAAGTTIFNHLAQSTNKPHTPTEPRPPSVIQPVERPWKAIELPSGEVYYYHKKTGETQWELPGSVDEIEAADEETNATAAKNAQDSVNSTSSSITVKQVGKERGDLHREKNGQQRQHKDRKMHHSSHVKSKNSPNSQPCDSSSSADYNFKRKFRLKLQKLYYEILHASKKTLGEDVFLSHARAMNTQFTRKHEDDYPEQYEWTQEVHERAKKYAKEYMTKHDIKVKDRDTLVPPEHQKLVMDKEEVKVEVE